MPLRRSVAEAIAREPHPGIIVAMLACYAVLLLFLSTLRPLWLDEVIQLRGTTGRGASEIIAYAAANLGGVPLGYLVQSVFLRLFGFSTVAARLPSVIFGALSVFATIRLGQALNLKKPYIAGAILAVLPFHLRYATEARPYSQALFFSILSTYFLVQYCNERTRKHLLAYAVAVLLATYSQAYSIFMIVPQMLWVAHRPKLLRTDVIRIALAAGLAALLFVPWLLSTVGNWAKRDPVYSNGFGLSVGALLMLLKEVSGAGYVGGTALFVAAGLGMIYGRNHHRVHELLGLSASLPIAIVVISNYIFNYFMATRQVIYILPPLVLLATEAFVLAPRQRRAIALVLAVALGAASLTGDVRWFARPVRENWRAAADMADKMLPPRGCIVTPGGFLENYALFKPSLGTQGCIGHHSADVLVAISEYVPEGQATAILSEMRASGFRCTRAAETGGTRFLLYTGRPEY